MSGPVHLIRRFLGSLSPRPLDPVDDAWVRTHLGAGESELWDQMSLADRKHAAGVARETDRLLGGAAPRWVIAAAALHDVGKVESALSTVARAVVTVVSAVFGRSRVVGAWRDRPGRRGRVAAYLEHDRIGAQLLDAAGSDPLTVAWAREHHRPAAAWNTPPAFSAALHAADDD